MLCYVRDAALAEQYTKDWFRNDADHTRWIPAVVMSVGANTDISPLVLQVAAIRA